MAGQSLAVTRTTADLCEEYSPRQVHITRQNINKNGGKKKEKKKKKIKTLTKQTNKSLTSLFYNVK